MRNTIVHRHYRYGGKVPVVQHNREIEERPEREKYEKPDWAKPKSNFAIIGYDYDEMRRKIKHDMSYEGILNYRITYSDSKNKFYMIDKNDRDFKYFDLSPDEFMRSTEGQAVASIMRPRRIE